MDKYKIINTCLVAIIVVETAIIFSPVLKKESNLF